MKTVILVVWLLVIQYRDDGHWHVFSSHETMQECDQRANELAEYTGNQTACTRIEIETNE